MTCAHDKRWSYQPPRSMEHLYRMMYADARHRVLVEALRAHAHMTSEEMLAKADNLERTWDPLKGDYR